ncbi:hypothetical protein [Falsiroseomonas sp. CW058]|uniref:hypothetical protein n=1 Tax=Falsiroseomonas sp. CW058 TaxID=3388664 RepID=UPI003D31CB2B
MRPRPAEFLQRLGVRPPFKVPGRGSHWLLIGLAALLLAVLWHVLLPAQYYRFFPVAIWLEGPIPAALGATAGLWWHRRDAAWLAALGACAFAFAAMFATILLLGPFLFGLIGTFRGLWAHLQSVMPASFAALLSVWNTAYVPYASWACLRTMLAWGSLAYLAVLFVKGGGRAWLQWRWRDLLQRRAFRRHQEQLRREYQDAYLKAVAAGQAPPSLPPGYVPGAARDGDGAQTAYWLLRIGYFLIGGALFWWAFGDQLALIVQRLTGPLPWWMGLGR